MPSIHQLRVFSMIVKHQKLTSVAKQLGITQPAVSFHLAKLEEETKLELFYGKGRNFDKLTEAGRILYHYAQQIVALEDEISNSMNDLHELQRGSIRIGSTYTPATYLLPQNIRFFRNKHPEIEISMEVKSAPVLLDMLQKFELDICILSYDRVDYPELEFRTLLNDRLILVLSPSLEEAKYSEWNLQDLQKLPMIMHEPASISRRQVDAWAAKHGITLRRELVVSATETMKALVKQGIGAAFLSELSCQQEISSGELVRCEIPDFPYSRQVNTVTNPNTYVTPAATAFLNYLDNFFKFHTFE